MSLCVLVLLRLAMHVFMCCCVCLYVSAFVLPPVCVSVSVGEGGVYVRVSVCLPVSTYSTGNVTWADTQRKRLTSPRVQSSLPLGSMVPS